MASPTRRGEDHGSGAGGGGPLPAAAALTVGHSPSASPSIQLSLGASGGSASRSREILPDVGGHCVPPIWVRKRSRARLARTRTVAARIPSAPAASPLVNPTHECLHGSCWIPRWAAIPGSNGGRKLVTPGTQDEPIPRVIANPCQPRDPGGCGGSSARPHRVSTARSRRGCHRATPRARSCPGTHAGACNAGDRAFPAR